MKNLYDYIVAEGILGDVEDQVDDAIVKDWVDSHWSMIFRDDRSMDAEWTPKGIDCGDGAVVWTHIVQQWKKGLRIPIVAIDEIDDRRMFSGVGSMPKDMADFELLVNEILANAKIDTLIVHTDTTWNPYLKLLMQHPGLQKIVFDMHDQEVDLSMVPFNKVHASFLSFIYRKAWNYDKDCPKAPLLDYKSIKGWKGDKISFSWTLGLVDVSNWRAGISRTIEFNDENKKALDYLFSRNKVKELIMRAGNIYVGSNRACSGAPYHAHITKSGSGYKYELKNSL